MLSSGQRLIQKTRSSKHLSSWTKLRTGTIPIGRTGDGAVPYDGSTNSGDWVGFIPFEELPNLYDPPRGLIVTANQRTVGASYKHTQFIRDAGAPWRARRIWDRLSSKPRLTMDDVRDT